MLIPAEIKANTIEGTAPISIMKKAEFDAIPLILKEEGDGEEE